MLGDRKPSPELPLVIEIVMVFDPATNVPEGIAYSGLESLYMRGL